MKDNSARTAIRRKDLSLPYNVLINKGLVGIEDSIFDYGHGRGDDMVNLREKGYKVEGWDLHYPAPPGFHEAPLEEYGIPGPFDLIHLGYVLNVIESPTKRVSLIRLIHKHMLPTAALSVAVRSAKEVYSSRKSTWTNAGDGYITSTGTFQKGYTPSELGFVLLDSGFPEVSIVHKEPVIMVARKTISHVYPR